MRIFHLLVCAIALWLITLVAQPVIFAKGRIEHHQMTSKIMADAGKPAEREVSIYLPEEYDTSELAYPVIYLIHQYSDIGNRTWFAYGIDYTLSVFDAMPNPLIVVMPSMGKKTRDVPLEEAHLIKEFIPFAEGMYRIINQREGRAISGFSRGGGDALHIVLSHPELFSVAAVYSAGGARTLPTRAQIEAHNQALYPLQFWLAYGLNEEFGMTADNHRFIGILEELDIPYIKVEDNGTHSDFMSKGRNTACMSFMSEVLGGGVTFIEPHAKLPATWGIIKHNR